MIAQVRVQYFKFSDRLGYSYKGDEGEREGYGAGITGITGIPNLNFDRAQDPWILRGG